MNSMLGKLEAIKRMVNEKLCATRIHTLVFNLANYNHRLAFLNDSDDR